MRKQLKTINQLPLFIIVFIFVIFCGNIAKSQVSLPHSGLIFILDNSGSMAEVFNGDIKLNAAKEAVNKALEKPELDSINMGLLEIGGHCVVKQVITPNINNRQAIITATNQIHPPPYLDAATPIAESIYKASKILKKYKGEKRIVLVSDGGANCQGEEEFPLSACDMVASLKNQGIDFTLDLIGYGAKNNKEFECIANLSDDFSVSFPNNPEELSGQVSQKTNPDVWQNTQENLDKATDFFSSIERLIAVLFAIGGYFYYRQSNKPSKSNKPSNNNNKIEKSDKPSNNDSEVEKSDKPSNNDSEVEKW